MLKQFNEAHDLLIRPNWFVQGERLERRRERERSKYSLTIEIKRGVSKAYMESTRMLASAEKSRRLRLSGRIVEGVSLQGTRG